MKNIPIHGYCNIIWMWPLLNKYKIKEEKTWKPLNLWSFQVFKPKKPKIWTFHKPKIWTFLQPLLTALVFLPLIFFFSVHYPPSSIAVTFLYFYFPPILSSYLCPSPFLPQPRSWANAANSVRVIWRSQPPAVLRVDRFGIVKIGLT